MYCPFFKAEDEARPPRSKLVAERTANGESGSDVGRKVGPERTSRSKERRRAVFNKVKRCEGVGESSTCDEWEAEVDPENFSSKIVSLTKMNRLLLFTEIIALRHTYM
jgi:hypothetical protein